MSQAAVSNVVPPPPSPLPGALPPPAPLGTQGVSPQPQAVVVQQKKQQQKKQQQKKQQKLPQDQKQMWMYVIIGLLVFGVVSLVLGIYMAFFYQKKVQVKVTKVLSDSYTFYDSKAKKSKKVQYKGAAHNFKIGQNLTRYKIGNIYMVRKSKIIVMLSIIFLIMVFPLLAGVAAVVLYLQFIKNK
jgi:uncharacterized membrane protein